MCVQYIGGYHDACGGYDPGLKKNGLLVDIKFVLGKFDINLCQVRYPP